MLAICFTLYFFAGRIHKKIKVYHKFSLATTLGINEDFERRDWDSEETYAHRVYAGKTFIQVSAFFINTSVGYQFDRRAAIGINLEYNYHSEQGLHFMPAYLNGRFNFSNKDSSTFIRGGYGTLLGLTRNFKKGNMYKIGAGYQFSFPNNAVLVGLDFTNKSFGYKSLKELSSISIFAEFMLF